MDGSEQKLSDAVTEMVLSGRSPDPASAQPSVAQSGACSIDAEEWVRYSFEFTFKSDLS